MRHEGILQKLTAKYQENIHKSHITFLNAAIDSLGRGAFLTCVNLGRGLKTKTTVKHNIKRVDYMLGSQCLHRERNFFYQATASSLIAKNTRSLILIDWSSTTPCRKFHILRASIVVENTGRALTIYEENHPESQLTARKVHASFIKNLFSIIPEDCSPIIITDAGFRVSWFKLIMAHGRDYIGRVRGRVHYQINSSFTEWKHCHCLYEQATKRARYLGKLDLTQSNQWLCNAYLIKKKPKGRKKKRVMGKADASTAGRKNAKRESEPWLLVSSLEGKHLAKKVINCYSKRMRIEEGFRDMKSKLYGIGLKFSRTKSAKRFDILLLIASLTHLTMYLLGRSVEQEGLARSFQTNSIRCRRVLSHVFVGLHIWLMQLYEKRIPKMKAILVQLKKEVACVYPSL